LVDALRHGVEAAFLTLIERYQHARVRLALVFAPNHTAAEEAVQDTWLDVLQGVLRIDQRTSLKLWIFGLLVDRRRARGEYVPFAMGANPAPGAPAIPPDPFLLPDHPKWPGHWAAFPNSWADVPESRLRARDTCEQIETTIEALPPQQRAVISLHDVEHWKRPGGAAWPPHLRVQRCVLLSCAATVSIDCIM
jgi:RNA polymerase sigma-70 factor, ECF subfamily